MDHLGLEPYELTPAALAGAAYRPGRDPPPDTTTLAYDRFGRKVRQVDPDMGTWLYEYDPLGNLTRQTDSRSKAVDLRYDPLNRLVATWYPVEWTEGSVVPGASHVTVHDLIELRAALEVDDAAAFAVGRRTSMLDGSGRSSWAYDLYGRVATATRVVDGHAYATANTHDAFDRVRTLAYPDDGTGVETPTYAYAANTLLSQLSSSL